jgi:hypothetical protein
LPSWKDNSSSLRLPLIGFKGFHRPRAFHLGRQRIFSPLLTKAPATLFPYLQRTHAETVAKRQAAASDRGLVLLALREVSGWHRIAAQDGDWNGIKL